MARGCWTPCQDFDLDSGSWNVAQLNSDKYDLPIIGRHNQSNALAAIAAAYHLGVPIESSCQALMEFTGVKRRLENKGTFRGVTIYSDFAHHPTAIKCTLQALREHVKHKKIIAVVDFASNTMQSGVHQNNLATAVSTADVVYFVYHGTLTWDIQASWDMLNKSGGVFSDISKLLQHLVTNLGQGDQVLIMSNGSFTSDILPKLQSSILVHIPEIY